MMNPMREKAKEMNQSIINQRNVIHEISYEQMIEALDRLQLTYEAYDAHSQYGNGRGIWINGPADEVEIEFYSDSRSAPFGDHAFRDLIWQAHQLITDPDSEVDEAALLDQVAAIPVREEEETDGRK